MNELGNKKTLYEEGLEKGYARACEEDYSGYMAKCYAHYFAEGRTSGIIDTLTWLVRDGLLSVSEAAKRAGMTEEQFEKLLAQ